MIRLVCPECRSKLDAKEALIGQTRQCPKCRTSILIARPASDVLQERVDLTAADDTSSTEHVEVEETEPLPRAEAGLERLDRQNRYVVLDRSTALAAWQNNGQGWMIKTRAGYLPAARNADKLPTQGNFVLVELRLRATDDGFRMLGIVSYQLAERWALRALSRGDDPIVEKIQGPGSLSKSQKFALTEHIKEQFMRDVWASVPEIHDYLLNTDYHSPGIDLTPSSR